MTMILYNPTNGRINGVTQDAEPCVKAWLADADQKIRDETAYLTYDETLDAVQAQDVFANATRGKYYVAGGVLYLDSQWTP